MALTSLSATTLLVVLSNFSGILDISKIKYHQIVIIKAPTPSWSPNSYLDSNLSDYQSSYKIGFTKPYIAAEFPISLFSKFQSFRVGNGIVTNRSMTSVDQYNKDTKRGYLNGPLESNKYYTGFQRACINMTFCRTSNWFSPVKTKAKSAKDTPVNIGLIVGATLGAVAGVFLLIFLPICCVHYRDKKAYDRKHRRHRTTVKRLISGRFFADPRLPVTYQDFLDHVSRLRFDDNKGFQKEFDFFDNTICHDHAASSNPQNIEKNRSHNIPAYDHSRVKLETLNDIPTSDYIHASYINTDFKDKAYIATQAPLPRTIPDFWRMIWEQNVERIVMLNNLVEKEEQVCSKYWPEKGDTVEYNNLFVSLIDIDEFACYVIRTFEIKKGTKGNPRMIKHFNYTSWPAYRDAPLHTLPFLEFVKEVNALSPMSENPTVVHCINGTGRTGVFIVVINQLKRVDQKGDLSIFSDVEEVCDARYRAIKSLQEYIFIHDCILAYFTYKDMLPIPLNGVADFVIEGAKEQLEGVSKFQLDFEKLSRANAKTDNKCEVGNLPSNRSKNRFNTVLPFDGSRVILHRNKAGHDGYINASFVDSYRKNAHFIATQAPLEETIFDFWRMVWEYNVTSIANLLEKDMFHPKEIYWPETGEVLEADKFQIKVLSFQSMKSFDLRQVIITNKEHKEESRLLRLFHLRKWPNDPETQNEGLYDVINTILQCKLFTALANGKRTLVHCSSGCGKTGVFIALHNAIEQGELEKSVNVFNIVRRLRQQRIVMVQTKNQYELIYHGLVVYFREFYQSRTSKELSTPVDTNANVSRIPLSDQTHPLVNDKPTASSTPNHPTVAEQNKVNESKKDAAFEIVV